MKKRDAVRRALAEVDAALGRARDDGRPVDDLNTLHHAVSIGLRGVIEGRLKHVSDAKAVEAVKGFLSGFPD